VEEKAAKRKEVSLVLLLLLFSPKLTKDDPRSQKKKKIKLTSNASITAAFLFFSGSTGKHSRNWIAMVLCFVLFCVQETEPRFSRVKKMILSFLNLGSSHFYFMYTLFFFFLLPWVST
jgi:hypothetical protein